MIMEPKLELQKLQHSDKQKIGKHLIGDGWKHIMSAIPSSKYPGKRRFDQNDIRLIENAASGTTADSPMVILMDEWSSMGKIRRPYVTDLLWICLEVNEIATASIIYEEIMKKGPISSDDHEMISQIKEDLKNDLWGVGHNNEGEFHPEDQIEQQILEDEESEILDCENPAPYPPEHGLAIHSIRYAYLDKITNRFSDNNKIGEGGFSDVYLGITEKSQKKIAIKKLKIDSETEQAIMDLMNLEVEQLPRMKHPNIIDLLGYSNDRKNSPCLMYPFLENGTLKDKLNELDGQERLKIMKSIAVGIQHIHTFHEKSNPPAKSPYVHRDIKPSNILLDNQNVPKICDFGLLRHGSTGGGKTMTVTIAVRGTQAYMPPEANRGDVSTKWDVWSWGVVLVEVVSGLPVTDQTREEPDLVSHFQGQMADSDDRPLDLLDVNANWDVEIGMKLFGIADRCLETVKQRRPTMTQILEDFSNL